MVDGVASRIFTAQWLSQSDADFLLGQAILVQATLIQEVQAMMIQTM